VHRDDGTNTVRITPTQTHMAITAGASGLLAVGATVAWMGASKEHPAKERLAAIGYAPGSIGLAATLIAGPVALGIGVARLGATKLGIASQPMVASLLNHPITNKIGRVSKAVAGVGIAALAGMIVGTAIVRAIGPNVPRAQIQDDQLPEPNMERAQLEARTTLAGIDRTKDDIVIWVPGTMRYRTPGPFTDGLKAWMGDSMSLVNMPARPDYQIPQGVADTSVALKIVLDDLTRTKRPGQRILLSGESQGAWALSKVMNEPKYEAMVDRAVIWGNPGVSPYQFDGVGTEKLMEMSDDLDIVSRSEEGDAPMMLEGLLNVADGHWSQVWRVPGTMINNPAETYAIARTGIRLVIPGGYERETHNYREFMNAAARFLSDAPHPDAVD